MTAESAGSKTAFLVVHGIGQHDKYDTLAGFAAGLLQSLGGTPTLQRRLVSLDGEVESALSIAYGGRQVDVFEYYYQPQLQRSVSGADVAEFVFRTSRRVRQLYREYDFPSKRQEVQRRQAAKEPADAEFIAWHYLLRHRSTHLSALLALPLVGLYRLWSLLPAPYGRPLEWLGSRLLEHYVLEVFGDLAAYLAIDPKARLNSKRREILTGCTRRIQALLAHAGYDHVIVAGHSLGSVVSYDALSRIAREVATGGFDEALCDKLRGFITFGSPLDKVAFLFWPTAGESGEGAGTAWDYLRDRVYAGLLPHFYGMRCTRVVQQLRSPVLQPQENIFDGVRWLNYHCKRDLISGYLDAYEGVDNREIRAGDDDVGLFQAFSDHSAYWASSEMFDGVVAEFLPPPAVAGADSPVAHLTALAGPGGNHFFRDRQRPLILGHRGVPLLHQENTLSGLRRALELGVDGVEFDVFKTRDGRIVVFHDEDTERLTGVKGNITQMTWDEVSRLRIQRRIDMGGGRYVDYPQEERIPLLEEVLDEFKGRLLMNVEMKAYAPNWGRRHTGTEVARVIRRCGAQDSVVITSFDFFMLYCLEQEFPGLHSGFAYDDGMMDNAIGEWLRRFPELAGDLAKLPGNQNDLSFLNFVLEANTLGRAIGSTLVDAEYTLIDSDTVAKFHARNMLVGAYTVFPLDTRFVRHPDEDQVAVVRRLTERRVDWMETDDPEQVLELYARGQVSPGG